MAFVAVGALLAAGATKVVLHVHNSRKNVLALPPVAEQLLLENGEHELEMGMLVCFASSDGELQTLQLKGNERAWELGPGTCAALPGEEGLPVEGVFSVVRRGKHIAFRSLGANGRMLQATRDGLNHTVVSHTVGPAQLWRIEPTGIWNVKHPKKRLGLNIHETRIALMAGGRSFFDASGHLPTFPGGEDVTQLGFVIHHCPDVYTAELQIQVESLQRLLHDREEELRFQARTFELQKEAALAELAEHMQEMVQVRDAEIEELLDEHSRLDAALQTIAGRLEDVDMPMDGHYRHRFGRFARRAPLELEGPSRHSASYDYASSLTVASSPAVMSCPPSPSHLQGMGDSSMAYPLMDRPNSADAVLLSSSTSFAYWCANPAAASGRMSRNGCDILEITSPDSSESEDEEPPGAFMGTSCAGYGSSDGSCGQENMLCDRPPLCSQRQGIVRALVSRINEMSPTPSRDGHAMQSTPAAAHSPGGVSDATKPSPLGNKLVATSSNDPQRMAFQRQPLQEINHGNMD